MSTSMTDSTGVSVSPVELRGRRAQDVCFLATHVALFVATVAILISTASASSDTLQLVLDDCTNTSVNQTVGILRAGLVGADDSDDDNTNYVADLVKAAPYFIGAAFGLAVLFGVLWMALLRYFAKPVVYGTLVVKGIILIALGLYLSHVVRSSCSLTTGNCAAASYPYVLCVLGGLYFLWLFCARRRIAQTAMLLEQSVVVVSTHPGLFLLSAVVLLVKGFVILLCFAAYIFLIAGSVTVTQTAGAPGQCTFDFHASTQTEVMLVAVTIYLYWSVQFWRCLRFYVTALTTGIWYFEKESLAAQEGTLAAKDYTRAPICTSLRTALTTGAGTIAFSSLVVAVCEMLKRMARKQSQNGGLLGCLIAVCIMCIVNYIEFLTRFALVHAALTGKSFCASGRSFLETCNRHGFLKVIIVDYLAAITLNFGALVFGLLVAALSVALVQTSVLNGRTADEEHTAVLVVSGVCAALVASVVLVFIAEILLNVVDAAYSCVVLDLDNHSRTNTFHRPVIAQAVLIKAKPDHVAVVMSPGGGASYAVAQPVVPTGRPVTYAMP